MDATIYVNPSIRHGEIHRHIYGYFLEHTANAIYGGMYDPASPLSDERGFRTDILEAARRLRVPILRWPGGNFASAYHWRDGVGPKEMRPRRLEITWSNTGASPYPIEESNHFGTNEFVAYCRAIGADPYINFNSASGDFTDAMRWMEYCNYAGDTEMARLRRAHGCEQPHGVTYWGIGNEVWGQWQVGYRTAAEYGTLARDIGHFARHVDPAAKVLVVGWLDPKWNLEVLEKTAQVADYLTVHLYTRTDFRMGVDDYYQSLGGSVGFEEMLRSVTGQVQGFLRANRIDRSIALSVDEWNLSHRGKGGSTRLTPAGEIEQTPPEAGGRQSPRTLMDALFVAGTLNGFHRLASSVKMANYVQMVNNHAPLLVRGSQLVKTPVYHVMDWYRNVLGEVAIGAHVDSERRAVRTNVGRLEWDVELPLVDATATLSGDGTELALAVVNRNREQPADCRLQFGGLELPDQGELRLLTGDSPYAQNTFEAPDAVTPHTGVLTGNTVSVPPHSLAVIRWRLAPHSHTA